MVLIRNNVQKESTYGWYPSQVNVYDNPRAHKGYDKECLFRHWQSGLHHTNSPQLSPVPSPGFKGSRKGSSHLSRAQSKRSTAQATLADLMVVGTPAQAPPQFAFDRSRPPSAANRHIPTPQINRKHHGWQPQSTIIGVVDPNGSFIAPSPKLDVANEGRDVHIETPKVDSRIKELTDELNKQLVTRPITPAQQISGSFRAQSASLNRPRVASSRPIKSAISRVRSWATTTEAVDSLAKEHQLAESSCQKVKSPARQCWSPPSADADSKSDEDGDRPASPVNRGSSSPAEIEDEVTYESQVDKYGWLAEVHGDPFNVKKVTERLPYTVRCDEPHVAEYPYKTRVIVGDTFFLNTIPRKPMTFAVHPEWQSEGFVEKRKQLEKQGRKFHTRNFGFVY